MNSIFCDSKNIWMNFLSLYNTSVVKGLFLYWKNKIWFIWKRVIFVLLVLKWSFFMESCIFWQILSSTLIDLKYFISLISHECLFWAGLLLLRSLASGSWNGTPLSCDSRVMQFKITKWFDYASWLLLRIILNIHVMKWSKQPKHS